MVRLRVVAREKQKRPGLVTTRKWPYCEVDYLRCVVWRPVTAPDEVALTPVPMSARMVWRGKP